MFEIDIMNIFKFYKIKNNYDTVISKIDNLRISL